jgi:catechol 2,3-dioxygenase-like lactoylglutathione lyase family enzyme
VRLELVALVVEDYDDAIAFFVDVLGFELVEDSPSLTNEGRPKRWVVVRPPGAATGLLLARADGGQQNTVVGNQVAGRVGFFLRVDDFAAAHQRMADGGVQFLSPARTEAYGQVAVFLDIAGNRWDLLGPDPPAGPGHRGHAPLRWAWPAYVWAGALLVYAVEKGYYASQGRLGIPGGRQVPASAYEDLPHVALRQWTLSALGLAAALLALATVLAPGRRVPRRLMLLALWGAFVPMFAGLPFVLHNVWSSDDPAVHQVLSTARPILQIGLWLGVTWSYQLRSRTP